MRFWYNHFIDFLNEKHFFSSKINTLLIFTTTSTLVIQQVISTSYYIVWSWKENIFHIETNYSNQNSLPIADYNIYQKVSIETPMEFKLLYVIQWANK